MKFIGVIFLILFLVSSCKILRTCNDFKYKELLDIETRIKNKSIDFDDMEVIRKLIFDYQYETFSVKIKNYKDEHEKFGSRYSLSSSFLRKYDTFNTTSSTGAIHSIFLLEAFFEKTIDQDCANVLLDENNDEVYFLAFGNTKKYKKLMDHERELTVVLNPCYKSELYWLIYKKSYKKLLKELESWYFENKDKDIEQLRREKKGPLENTEFKWARNYYVSSR